MARNKRRHPGVTLIKPRKESRIGWRIRFTDPDTGGKKWESVDQAMYPNKAGAEDYAVRVSERIANRRRELDEGASPFSNTALSEAVELFYSEALARKSERTHEAYRLGTDRLVEWGERNRIETTDDLTRGQLMGFRAEVMKAPKQYSRTGTKQGGKAEAREYRALTTCNKELRAVSRALGWLIDKEKCSKLSHDDLRRALKQEKVETEKKEFLRPNELRKLLEACERHDGATYSMTRNEKEAGHRGGTPRYEPITAFVVFTLLTGMRSGEALAVKWSNVDLNALDAEGRKVGEIALPGSITKTKKPRTIDLAVSPALRRLLVSMHLRSGGRGRVFESLTKDTVIKAMRRLRKTYGAPSKFSYQVLRVTCSTYLTNAPGIYGGASAFLSAKQLGHSVTIAEKHYTGLVRVSAKHRTLEAAMQIEAKVGDAVERAEQRRAA